MPSTVITQGSTHTVNSHHTRLAASSIQDKHMPSTVIAQDSTHTVNSHHTRLAARHTSRQQSSHKTSCKLNTRQTHPVNSHHTRLNTYHQQPSHKTLAAGSRIQHNFIVPVRKFIWPNTHPGITAMQIPLDLFLSFCIPP